MLITKICEVDNSTMNLLFFCFRERRKEPVKVLQGSEAVVFGDPVEVYTMYGNTLIYIFTVDNPSFKRPLVIVNIGRVFVAFAGSRPQDEPQILNTERIRTDFLYLSHGAA